MNRYNHESAPQPMTADPEGYWVTHIDHQAKLAEHYASYTRCIARLTDESTQNFIVNKQRIEELAAMYDHQTECIIASHAQHNKNHHRIAYWSWTLLVFISVLEIYARVPWHL
jgi:hypothetical protein